MRSAIYGLFGAVVTIATAWALGTLALRRTSSSLDAVEERLLAFLTGSACLSTLVFALCTVGLARKSVFLGMGLLAVLAAIRFGEREPGAPLPPIPRPWKRIAVSVIGVLAAAYAFRAMSPGPIPDPTTHHLALLDQAHGFIQSGVAQPEGFELLFLYAFALGRQSAALLVGVALLVSLTWLVLNYGLGIAHPAVGVCSAIVTCASLAAGQCDLLSYADAGSTAVVFALFYALQIWEEHGAPALLVPAGILAGFSYSSRHAAILAVPYALAFIGWTEWRKHRRAIQSLAAFSVSALVLLLPWMVRNGISFPGSFADISFAAPYGWGLLLLALVVVWNRQGRTLVLAASILGFPFFIRVLPFAVLAAGLALFQIRRFFASARALSHSPVIQPLVRIPRYVWIFIALVALCFAAYVNPAATARTYFGLEQAWVEHWPVERQKHDIEGLAPAMCRIGLLRPVRLQVEPGVSFQLDPRDLIGVSILRSGAWQPEIWDSISPDLREGSVFLDVGAHIGYFSMKAAIKVGKTGHVLAFEPNPETLKLLRENVKANQAGNVIVEAVACTDREQVLTLYAAARINTGASSLARQNAAISVEEAPRPYVVRGRPIDDVVRELNLARVDAMKIDVEGAEVSVLRGASATLRRFHPKVVVEVVAQQLASFQTTPEEVASVFREAGYHRSKPVGPTDWEWTY
jgi:FkbM family methyltransferase